MTPIQIPQYQKVMKNVQSCFLLVFIQMRNYSISTFPSSQTTASIIQFNGKLPQQTQPMQSVLWLKFSAEYASWGMYDNYIISPNLQSYIYIKE